MSSIPATTGSTYPAVLPPTTVYLVTPMSASRSTSTEARSVIRSMTTPSAFCSHHRIPPPPIIPSTTMRPAFRSTAIPTERIISPLPATPSCSPAAPRSRSSEILTITMYATTSLPSEPPRSASAQLGYVGDYNLYDLTPGAVVARWSNQPLTLGQLQLSLGLDKNSFAGNPMYKNPAGADGIRGFVGGVDHGADDDFSLTPGSPAIDRGDPTAPYFNEPVGATFGDGSRIDIGAGGNTANAAQSPTQLVQLFGQTADQRYQVGQAATISFRSDGLVAEDPVLFINVGGGFVTGPQPW